MANASCSTATLVSNVLTVTGAVSGTILVGMTITAAGVPAKVTIASYGTGSGQAGTYNCSASAANVTVAEAMVFSLDWNYPCIGNARAPQLIDMGRAAGFGLVMASVFGAGSAGPGAEYQHGTHAAALYNAQAITGTHVFNPANPRQGNSVAPTILTQPQYPEARAPALFDVSPLERIAKYQPLQLITAAPQPFDWTPELQPDIANVSAGTAQSSLGLRCRVPVRHAPESDL